MSTCPAQAVTPVFSSAALATNSDATNTVAGSPNPARLWFSVRTPVAQSDSAQPMHTTITGSRSQTKSTITEAMIAKTIQMSAMISPRCAARTNRLRDGFATL